METWKSIPNTNGFYEVSNIGNVRSWKRRCGGHLLAKKPRVLKKQLKGHGYEVVKVFFKDGLKYCGVHRLVLLAFCGEPQEGYQAAHLNGVRNDNRLENLKWCSPKENSSHRKWHGTECCGEKQGNAKLTESQAIQVHKIRKEKGWSHQKIANYFNVSKPTITAILVFRNWAHLQGVV